MIEVYGIRVDINDYDHKTHYIPKNNIDFVSQLEGRYESKITLKSGIIINSTTPVKKILEEISK